MRFATRRVAEVLDSCDLACSRAPLRKESSSAARFLAARRRRAPGDEREDEGVRSAANIGAISHHAGIDNQTTSGGHSKRRQGGGDLGADQPAPAGDGPGDERQQRGEQDGVKGQQPIVSRKRRPLRP